MKRVKKRMYKALSLMLLSSLLVGTITSPITLNAANMEIEELLDTRAVDATKPVIEKVEFPDNGKTVDAKDKLPIYIDAYDADSGIAYIDVDYMCTNEDGKRVNNSVRLNKGETRNRYEGELIALDGGYTSGFITGIRVVDNSYHYFDSEVGGYGTYIYTFNIENWTIIENGKVNEIVLSNNEKQVERGSFFDLELVVSATDIERFSNINIYFSNENESKSYSLNKVGDKFVTQATVNDDMKSGKWTIENIYGYIEGVGVEFEFPNEEFWFEVLGEDDTDTDTDTDTESPKIESIKMDKKNGDILAADDIINFEVKATDNVKLSGTASLTFQATADILSPYIDILLTYDESKDVYVGSYTVEDSTYPCEWYLSSISVYDDSENFAKLWEYLDETGEEFYFNVTKDGTFVSTSYDEVIIRFCEFDTSENVWREGQAIEKENVERRATFKDAGVIFPEAKFPFEGLKFIGWTDDKGKMYTDTSEIVSSYQSSTCYITLYPVYDQDIVTVSYKYPNKKLKELESVTKAILLPKNSTYGDALKEASKQNINNIYSEKSYSWNLTYYSDELENQLPNLTANIAVSAIYPGYKVVEASRIYYNESGNMVNDGVMIVKDGTTYESIKDEINTLTMPKIFDGLKFKSWSTNYDHLTGIVENDYLSMTAIAQYENLIVRFFVDDRIKERYGATDKLNNRVTLPSFEEYNIAYAVVAEKGEILEIPEIQGYENIVWNRPHGEKVETPFEVKGNEVFLGYGDKVDIVDPDKPVEPDKPEVPNKPETPVVPDTPSTDGPGETTKPETPVVPDETPTVANRPSAEVIEKVVSNITEAKEGETVEVNMGDATVLPVDFLASARGKDVTIKLVMNGYTWSINGQDILASSLKDINLEVTLDSDAVPSHVVKSLAGDNPIKQLSLTHNGDFGFKADLTVNVGNEHQGKYGNLYYYDSDGKMVFMNAGTINDKGEVSLSFSHASDYVVVINDKIMDNNETDVPESGDAMNHMLWITSMMASLVVVGMMYNKKRQFIK